MGETAAPDRRSKKAMSGLLETYKRKRANTLLILEKAAKKLADEGTPITLGRLSEATKAYSETGKRIAETTILRNEACREFYEKIANPKRRKPSTLRALRRELGEAPSDEERRRMNYLTRLCKADLIAMVIRLEGDLGIMQSHNATLREQLLLPELKHYID